jgi:proton-coupled amino acid transporter
MLKCFIGIGILATPAAVKTVGIVGGAIGIMFCGILNMYTMKMQIACKEKVGAHISSYSELGLAVLGANGQAFIDLCITISQFGFCIAYLIFIGN